jgi:NTE family protein
MVGNGRDGAEAVDAGDAAPVLAAKSTPARQAAAALNYETVFVLGGGGHLGAYEVGMLKALLEAGVKPDAVLGTSVGAINGAALAADPTSDAVARLEKLWTGLSAGGIFEDSLFTRLGTMMRSRTHMHSNTTLRRMLAESMPVERIEDLQVPFQCVAASIERAAEHWFSTGPIVEAVLASCAVPGLLPPVRIDGEHFLDGGLVDSVPVGRAVALGARTVYVLHAGRLEQPLQAPKQPWEVAAVAFEISRRHRFARDMAQLPEGVTVHLLPTGADRLASANWAQYVRYRDYAIAHERIQQAYRASLAYLGAAPE